MRKKKDNSTVKSHRKNGIFLAIAGVLLMALGIWDYIGSKAFAAKAKTTEGVVTEVVKKTKKEKEDDGYMHERTYYYAKISYKVGGKEYNMSSSESTTYTSHLDEKIKIYYNPDDPDEARIDEGGGLSERSKWIGGFGMLALIGSIVYFVLAKRANQQS